jgi:hypothetical protein
MSNIEEFNDQQRHLEELKKSYETNGPLHPVIETQFGVAAGNNRLKAVKNWPREKRTVKDKLEHLQIMMADNLFVPKPENWWKKAFKEIAEELVKQGVETQKVVDEMHRRFGFTLYRIYRYVPQEYKRYRASGPQKESSPYYFDLKTSEGGLSPRREEERPRNGTIEEVRNGYVSAITEPLTREPFRKGFSPQSSTFQVKAMTLPHLKLVSALNAAHVDCRAEEPYDRNQTNARGDHLFYSTDIFLLKRQDVVIEVKGEGSKTDDPKRMKWFKDRNIKVISFTNEHVNQWAGEIAEAIKGFLS